MTFVLSLFLIGRSSIIISGVYLIVSLFFLLVRFKKNNVDKLKVKILGVFIVCLVSVLLVNIFWKNNDLIINILEQTNISKGAETTRYVAWTEYLLRLDAAKFFFGSAFEDIPLIANEFNGNPHNSYINMHSKTGVFMLGYVLLVVFSVQEYMKKKEYYLLCIMLFFMIRIFSDTTSLYNVMDYILYYFILYPLLSCKNNVGAKV